MSIRIKYAYQTGQVWMYRRNYPQDVRQLLGSQALKQSLKTADPRLARQRVSEVDAHYDAIVTTTRTGGPRSGSQEAELPYSWVTTNLTRLRSSLDDLGQPSFNIRASADQPDTAQLVQAYLGQRSDELRPGGFKSVRYSLGLFSSRYGSLKINQLGREEGRQFLGLLPGLSVLVGKDEQSAGQSLDWLLAFSRHRPKIGARTQKRIWSQVNHFLNWVVYEGHLEQNPFATVRFDRKVVQAPYAVPTDPEVSRLLLSRPRDISQVLEFCLLSGMRSGEAVGLLREDIVTRGNLGSFVKVRPNAVRQLKTAASEREVPLHSRLEEILGQLPSEGRLFPELNVNLVTKRFAETRRNTGLERPGLVFHSTRKWFITQCERTGVPEHWTASLVGHQSARSENQLTYSIYSAGISDEQKRSIVDRIRLPV